MKKIFKNTNLNYLTLILFFLSFIFGGFYDIVVLTLIAILGIALIIKFIKNKRINIYINNSFIICIIFLIGSLISIFFAVDKYYSIIGLFRAIAIFFFYLNVSNIEKEERENLYKFIPCTGISMVIISLFLAIFKTTRPFVFSDANRLTGFFQYSNSFSIFLLIGLVILLENEKNIKYKLFETIILIIGILLTGSRIVFGLTFIYMILFLFSKKEKKEKLKLFITFLTLVGIAIVIAVLTKNFQNIGRFLTSSIVSSSLIGRFVYYKDSLKIILKNPFGLRIYGIFIQIS